MATNMYKAKKHRRFQYVYDDLNEYYTNLVKYEKDVIEEGEKRAVAAAGLLQLQDVGRFNKTTEVAAAAAAPKLNTQKPKVAAAAAAPKLNSQKPKDAARILLKNAVPKLNKEVPTVKTTTAQKPNAGERKNIKKGFKRFVKHSEKFDWEVVKSRTGFIGITIKKL